MDQLDRYLRWYQEGHLSNTRKCFDIGSTIRQALLEFSRTNSPHCGSTHSRSAGNGSIMRLAPVPLFYAANPVEAIEKAAESSKTTHGAATCVGACRHMAGIIVGAANGLSKEVILSPRYSPVPEAWRSNPLVQEIDEIASGSFTRKEPPEIQGSGYMVKSLEAALWAFLKIDSYEKGCLLAVNLGYDADTTRAVYGQIVGAQYGEKGISRSWRDRVAPGGHDRVFCLPALQVE